MITATITVYRASNDTWRYRVKVGDIVSNSGTGYVDSVDAKRYAEQEARLLAAQIRDHETYEVEV
jgi:hypothetical protein